MSDTDGGGAPRNLELEVPAGENGRLDRFLVRALPGISRSYAHGLVAAGQVQLQHGDARLRAARKGEQVAPGDRVLVTGFVYPDERRLTANPELVVHVLHEDAAVLVLDKPPGLPSHPNRYEDHHTLVSFLLARYPEVRHVGDDPLRPAIAHRLDTDTSGLLVAARTDVAYRHLRKQFDERRVEKEYLALVVGNPDLDAGEIAIPLGHHPRDPRRMVAVASDRVRIRGRVREAFSSWRVLARNPRFALLAVRTRTGRMHQVRVHLSAVGLPLVGDPLYGRGPGRILAPRHFLHAHHLAFAHPDDEHRLALRSALPADLVKVLQELGLEMPKSG